MLVCRPLPVAVALTLAFVVAVAVTLTVVVAFAERFTEPVAITQCVLHFLALWHVTRQRRVRVGA